jgi:hypothetical protein
MGAYLRQTEAGKKRRSLQPSPMAAIYSQETFGRSILERFGDESLFARTIGEKNVL